MIQKKITLLLFENDAVSIMLQSTKLGLSPSKKVCFICFHKSPLKMMKNASNFMLKALLSFVLTF